VSRPYHAPEEGSSRVFHLKKCVCRESVTVMPPQSPRSPRLPPSGGAMSRALGSFPDVVVPLLLHVRSRGGTAITTQPGIPGGRAPALGQEGPAMSDAQHPQRDAQRTAGAERMARHRKCRRQGLRSVVVAVRDSEIDALVARKLLAPELRNERSEISWALGLLLDDVLGKKQS
jgi:hypothetical protein